MHSLLSACKKWHEESKCPRRQSIHCQFSKEEILLAKSTKRAQPISKVQKRAPQNVLSFILESHWSARLVKAVWHEWCSLNSDWLGWSRLFLLKCARMFVYVFLKWLWESWQDRNWPIVWRIWALSRFKLRNDFGLLESSWKATFLYTKTVKIR